ncbi:MAG: homoserine kinase [Firmicutes bacterium]|nr:homoserine kinase [Bacillota bacterium]
MKKFDIYVPASTTNLGPGFDVLGIALDIYNIFEVETGGTGIEIKVAGEGEGILPCDEKNLFIKAMKMAFDALGEPMPGIKLLQKNTIPLNRGLGSSASAALGGLLAAREILGKKLSGAIMTELAVELEGHPDNIIAAWKGGAVINYVENGQNRHIKMIPPDNPDVVVLIPPFPVETKKAREILPDTYSKKDVVENLRNVSLLVFALTTGDYRLLSAGCRDTVHQPYRAKLIPGLYEVIDAAVEAGAYGSYLSGSGSTIAAFCSGNSETVASAMQRIMLDKGVETKTIITKISETGSYIKKKME